MSVLQIAPYMTSNDVPLLSQCKAGFGYMVYDIAKSLALDVEVDALLNNYRYREFESDGIRFRPASFGLFLKNLFKCSSPVLMFHLWRKYHMQLRTFIRLVYAWIMSGYYYDVIKKGHYDILHIHGCGFYDELWMDICHRLNQKFIITLHGLNSFSDSVKLEQAGKRYERDFLKRVVEGEFPITVISSGIKNMIMNDYHVKDCDNIKVVCNAFSFSEKRTEIIDIRKQYNIPTEASIILYVGNLCQRKNQKQIINAFSLLPASLKSNTFILFMGKDLEKNYHMEEYVKSSEWKERFVLCGNIDKEIVPNFYEQANGVVLLSISEGFGLSLIEGMHFGLPCMTFCDLDAFVDIYDKRAVVGLADRNDQTVANGMIKLLTTKWDKEKIKKYSKKFESEQMANNYLSVFKQIIRG